MARAIDRNRPRAMNRILTGGGWLVLASIALSACEARQTPLRPVFERPALAPDAVVARVAFGSCADQKKPQPIWSAVREADPDLFLFMGDNVYGDVKRDGRSPSDSATDSRRLTVVTV